MLIGIAYKTKDVQNNKTVILVGYKSIHVSNSSAIDHQDSTIYHRDISIVYASSKLWGITIDENLKWINLV